eukprot:91390-Rhodomonas_salina.4
MENLQARGACIKPRKAALLLHLVQPGCKKRHLLPVSADIFADTPVPERLVLDPGSGVEMELRPGQRRRPVSSPPPGASFGSESEFFLPPQP